MYLSKSGDAKIGLDRNRPVYPGEPSTPLPSICYLNSMGKHFNDSFIKKLKGNLISLDIVVNVSLYA